MQTQFLTPLPTIHFLGVSQDHQGFLVTAAASGSTTCPDCGTPSTSRRGYYVRRLQDLLVQGRPVRVQVQVSRWRCGNTRCARQSFAERLDSAALSYARRTRRLTELVCVLGHAAGGLPAERLLHRLGMPHSDDTVLRSVKRQAARRSGRKVRVAGIDDWSQRQGHSYGTIVVDLERRQVVEVLGDRSAEVTAQWLQKHSEVEIVSRDRCGLYAQGARQGAPQAEQVADRFHLLQNLRETLERQLGRSNSQTAIASPMSSPPVEARSPEADLSDGVSGHGLESAAQNTCC